MKRFKIFLTFLFFLWFFALPVCSVLAIEDNQPIARPLDEVKLGGTGAMKLNVPIGTLTYVNTANGTEFARYIQKWYSFVIGSVGIMAAVIIMWGGFKWLTSHGNSAMIGDAKDRIFAALTGLVIAFLSFTIFQLINPDLLNIGLPTLKIVSVSTTANVVVNANDGGVINPATGQVSQNPGDYIPTPGNLAEYTKNNEGLKVKPYRNTINGKVDEFDQIGYGHKITGQENPAITYNQDGSISPTEAERLFAVDYEAARNGATSAFPSLFTTESLQDTSLDDRRAILIDMTYQMGEGKIETFDNLQNAVANRNWDAAGAEITNSLMAGQTPNRANRDRTVMENGSFSSLSQ